MEKRKLKILVLGASGMAGHTISLYFQKMNHEVIALSRKKLDYVDVIQGAVTDFNFLKRIISESNYDAVINAVGILNSNAEEGKTLAVLLNSYLPHYLAEITYNSKTKIIQMSTDCVFSGSKGNYLENSFKDGDTFYDRTKALGELNDSKNLTFRNSIIGPDRNRNGIGLFNWFMKQDGQINGYANSIWTGVTTLTLAKAMEQAIYQNLTGVYNLVNNVSINKYDLTSLFNKHLKNSTITISKDLRDSLDKSLICTRNDFNFVVPSYERMIIEMKEWIQDNKELYPHYFEVKKYEKN